MLPVGGAADEGGMIRFAQWRRQFGYCVSRDRGSSAQKGGEDGWTSA